jgi:hypothetical protein
MRFEDYKKLNATKLKSYLDEGFSEEQIQTPLGDILVSLNSIINRYKSKFSLDKWSHAANFMQCSFTDESGQKKDSRNDYLYEQVRVYIRKEPSKIEGLKYRMDKLPHKKKRSRYAEILSEIALDCINACVKEFKKEAKTQQSLQLSLKKETLIEMRTQREQTSELQKSKKLNLVNEEWEKSYGSGKKRNHPVDQDVKYSKKCKRVHFLDAHNNLENTSKDDTKENKAIARYKK